MSDLDLKEFKKSEYYQNLSNELPLAINFGMAYEGFPIEIDGDLISISIFGKNKISLCILYDFDNYGEKYANVIYEFPDNVNFIRNNILPMTRIRVKATYTKTNNIYDGGEILFYNEPLLYGHYVCPDCGYDYGIKDSCTCNICEEESTGKLIYVTNLYYT